MTIRTIQTVHSQREYLQILAFLTDNNIPYEVDYEECCQIIRCDSIAFVWVF